MNPLFRAACALLAAALCSACAPLQQAPLVYSSRQTFGVDFSTNASEQPGMSVNVGFKNVDAAYVPVAVAKPCDDKVASPNCTHKNYELQPVFGTHDTRDGSNSNPVVDQARQLLARQDKLKADKEQAELAYANAKSVLDARSDQLKEAQRRLQQAQDAEKAAPPVSTVAAGPTPTATVSPSPVNDLQRTRDESERQQKAAAADLEARRSQLETAKKQLENLDITALAQAATIVRRADDSKRDAYSVFGTFNGNTAFGTATGAGAAGGATGGAAAGAASGAPGGTLNATAAITLGKVFSTGVASQHLTQGIASYYQAMTAGAEQTAYEACMRGAKSEAELRGWLKDGKPDPALKAEDKAELDKLLKACRPRAQPAS